MNMRNIEQDSVVDPVIQKKPQATTAATEIQKDNTNKSKYKHQNKKKNDIT